MTSRPWYETFFDGIFYEILRGESHENQAAKEARLVRRALRLRKGQHVLDVPCGMGRLAVPLAKMGMTVTGVDLTPSYIRHARKRARAEGVDIRFIESDMRRIDFEGEFDGAFNWFGSFGYFSRADNLAFTRRVLKALKPGGRFLVEGINRTWLLAHFLSHGEEETAGVRISHNARFDRRTSRIYDTWLMTKGRRTEQHTISMQMYDGSEISDLLRRAGFKQIEVYGRDRLSSSLGPLTSHSRRFIAVGTKTAS
jgi:ubiquinone/menaquinone biosynthesis C-methylase UbiE